MTDETTPSASEDLEEIDPPESHLRAFWPYIQPPKVDEVIHDKGKPIGKITEVYQEGEDYVVDIILYGNYGVELHPDEVSIDNSEED